MPPVGPFFDGEMIESDVVFAVKSVRSTSLAIDHNTLQLND